MGIVEIKYSDPIVGAFQIFDLKLEYNLLSLPCTKI